MLTYQLHYYLHFEKRMLDVERKKEINKFISDNKLKEYAIVKNGVKVFDNRSRYIPTKRACNTKIAISNFIEFCNSNMEDTSESNIAKIEHDTYGDYICYKDGTKAYRPIED